MARWNVLREWLVIESAHKRAVFRDDNLPKDGYIPRDVAEALLGRCLVEEGRHTWFTDVESAKMKAHPEYIEVEPQNRPESEYL